MVEPIPDFTEDQSLVVIRTLWERQMRAPTQNGTKAAAADADDGRQISA